MIIEFCPDSSCWKDLEDHLILLIILQMRKQGSEWVNTLKVIWLLLNEGQELPHFQPNCFVHSTGRIIYHMSGWSLKIKIINYICQCLKEPHGSLNFKSTLNFHEETETQITNILCPNFKIIFNPMKIPLKNLKINWHIKKIHHSIW